MTESFDIAELLTLAKDNSPESRMRLFGLMGDLFLNKGGYLSTEERTNLSGILSTLLPQADKESRLKLAYDLSGSTAVPRDLARRIAEDEIDVASPMLFKSTKLSDQDLIELSARSPQHAGVIATRRGLPMAVADTLMRGGQTDVVQALLDNASSQISVAALHTALEKAKSSEELQDSISRRVELPEEIAAELMEWAGGRVRERLMDRFNILMVEIVPPSEADEELPPLDLNQYNKANGIVAEPEPDLAGMPPTGFARYGAATNATPQPIGLSSLKPKPAAAPAPQGNTEEDARLEETRVAEAEALRTKAKKDLVAKTLAALAHDSHPEPAAAAAEATPAPAESAATPAKESYAGEPYAEEPAPVPVAAQTIAAPAVEDEPIEYVPPPSLKRDLTAERLTFDAVDMELELIDVGDAADMPPIAEPMARSEHESTTASLAMDLELELEQAPAIDIELPEQTPAEVSEAEAPEAEALETKTVAADVASTEVQPDEGTSTEISIGEISIGEISIGEVSAAEISPAETPADIDAPVDTAAEMLDVAESLALAESMAAEPVAEITPEPVDAAAEEEPVVAESQVIIPEAELPTPEPAAEDSVVDEPVAEETLAAAAPAEASGVEEPAIEESAVEAAAIEEAIAEESIVEEPVAEVAVATESSAVESSAAESSAAEPTTEEVAAIAESATEEAVEEEPVAEIAAETPPAETPPAEISVAEDSSVDEPVQEEAAEVPEIAVGAPESEAIEEPLAAAEPPVAEAPEPLLEPIAAKTEAAPMVIEPVAPFSDPRKEALLANFIKSSLAPERQAESTEPKIEAAPIAEPTTPISDPRKERLLANFIKSALASAAKVIPGVSAKPPVPEAPISETPVSEAPASEVPVSEVPVPEVPASGTPALEQPAPEASTREASTPEASIPETLPAASIQPEDVAVSEEPQSAAIEQVAAKAEPEIAAEEVVPEPEPKPEPAPVPVKPAAAARGPLPKGAEHKLTTTLLIAVLNNGSLAHAEAMFAQMTGLRIGLVRRLAAESGGEGLAMAARAIHMAREDFSTIYLLWRRLKSRDGFVPTSDHGKALDFFDSAPQDRVMSVMTRWRKDPEKLFATG